MLNFNEGQPLGVILDHNKVNKIIYFSDNKEINNDETDDFICEDCDKKFDTNYDLKRHKSKKCRKSTKDDIIDKYLLTTSKTKIPYEFYIRNNNTEIKILNSNETIFPIIDDPRNNSTASGLCLWAVGPPGSGKSYFINSICQTYIKQYRGDIILFTIHDSDVSYNTLDSYNKFYKIKVDAQLLNEPLDINSFRGTLLIFDDVFTGNPKLNKIMQEFMLSIIKNYRGREVGGNDTIHCIFATQECTSGDKFNIQLARQCKEIVIFPTKSNNNLYSRLLTSYLNLSNNIIDKIYSLNTRWVYIHRYAPQYLIYPNGIFLL